MAIRYGNLSLYFQSFAIRELRDFLTNVAQLLWSGCEGPVQKLRPYFIHTNTLGRQRFLNYSPSAGTLFRRLSKISKVSAQKFCSSRESRFSKFLRCGFPLLFFKCRQSSFKLDGYERVGEMGD